MKIRARLVALTIAASAFLGMTAVVPAQATTCLSNPAVTQGQLSDNALYTLCTYDNYDFTGLTATGVEFRIGTINAASFSIANFHNTIFTNVVGHSINFTQADMTGSDFGISDMQYSDLTQANFRNTNLHFTHLEHSTMNQVNLTGANLNNTFLDGSDLTGALVTQAQLAVAVLTDTTVCPDGYQLGVHTGDCFSALKPLVPVLSTPVLTADGFTFAVTNYNELYTYTLTVVAGTATPTQGSPAGSNLPITVTGVPNGTSATVQVTSTIGSVTASANASNTDPLAKTGSDNATPLALGSTALTLGLVLSAFAAYRRRKA